MEGAATLLFMGSDGSGPYLVEGPPGNGALPVSATLSPLAQQNVNLTEVLNSPTVIGGLPGLLAIGGPGAAGAALDASNPLKIAGSDGVDLRVLQTDPTGRQVVVGAAAPGSAPAGSPVLVAGSDGALVHDLATDTSGRLEVVGTVPAGAAPDASNPLKVAGTDGVAMRLLQTDAAGRLAMVGAAASGAAPAGNPVLVAGSDGALAHDLATDTSGRLVMVGAAAAGAAAAGAPVLMAGTDGVDARTLLTDATGAVYDRPAKAATYCSGYAANIQGLGVLFQLKGSTTKVVRITRITFTGYQPTTAAAVLILLRRDTAAASGGVPVGQSIGSSDSTNPATTAVATGFSTAATENGVGNTNYLFNTLWPVLGNAAGQLVDLVLGGLNSRTQELVLRNANEYFSVITISTLPASSTFNLIVEWTEE